MPQRVTVLRDGKPTMIEATGLVQGDVVLLEEGARIAADVRILSGAVEVDLSALNIAGWATLVTDAPAHRLIPGVSGGALGSR
jgi:cation transport ATPase